MMYTIIGTIVVLFLVWKYLLPYFDQLNIISFDDKSISLDDKKNSSTELLENYDEQDDLDLVKEVVTIHKEMTRIVFEKNFGKATFDEKGKQINVQLQSLDDQIISDYFKNCLIDATKIVLLSRKHTLEHGYEAVVEYRTPKKKKAEGTGLKCEISFITSTLQNNRNKLVCDIFKLLNIELEQLSYESPKRFLDSTVIVEYWPKNFDLEEHKGKLKKHLRIECKMNEIKVQIYNQYLEDKALYPKKMQLCESINGYFEFDIINEL